MVTARNLIYGCFYSKALDHSIQEIITILCVNDDIVTQNILFHK